MVKSVMLSVRLDDATRVRIEQLLAIRFDSLSELVRKALDDLLSKEERRSNRSVT